MTAPNFNSNTSGGLLEGLASLLKGLGTINNPDQQKRADLIAQMQANPALRDQYAMQYQSNPDAINAMLGRKPMIGTGNYEDAYSMITGPLSPEAKARMDILNSQAEVAKASASKAKNDQALNAANANIIQKGQSEDQVSAESGLAPGQSRLYKENGKNILEQAPSAFRNPADRVTYEELKSGKVLTPAERSLAQATATEAGARADEQKARTEKLNETLAQQNADKVVAQNVLARLKGQNLYLAHKQGKVSESELSSVMNYDKGKEQYTREQDEYYKTQQLRIEQERLDQTKQQTADAKKESLRNWYSEKLMNVGHPVGLADIDRIIADPISVLNSTDPKDAPLKQAVQEVRDAAAKKDQAAGASLLSKAHAQFFGEYKTALSNLQKEGKEPDDATIQNLNIAAKLAYEGTAHQPPVVGIVDSKTDKKGFFSPKPVKVLGLVSMDPEDKSIYRGIPLAKSDSAGTKPDSTNTQAKPLDPKYEQVAQMIANGQASEDNLKDPKVGLDSTTISNIISRVKALKGDTTSAPSTAQSAPSSAQVTQQAKPTVKPQSKPNFKADTTGLPPVTNQTDSTITNARNKAEQDVMHDYPTKLDPIKYDMNYIREYYKRVAELKKAKK